MLPPTNKRDGDGSDHGTGPVSDNGRCVCGCVAWTLRRAVGWLGERARAFFGWPPTPPRRRLFEPLVWLSSAGFLPLLRSCTHTLSLSDGFESPKKPLYAPTWHRTHWPTASRFRFLHPLRMGHPSWRRSGRNAETTANNFWSLQSCAQGNK